MAGENQWKPEIAFLGGIVLPFTAKESFKPDHLAPNMRLAFAHTLSERVSLGYNLGVEWDGESANPSYFYSASLGAALNEKTGFFIESYGWLTSEPKAAHLLDAGLTYLLLPNFQFDVSGGIGIQNSIDNFISLGITCRLPD